MKFLLTALNAKYIHSNPAIFSLRNYASEYKESISLAEYTINMSVEEILADIYKKTPDVIGFSCYIWNWTMIQEIIIELHKIMPQLPIWLGGPEVSFDALEICKSYPMITGIMIGEGENTFCELMSYYTKQEIDLKQIKVICTREGYTEERELTDLDTIPFLYQSLDEFENRIIYYESSRGCPFRCSYCLSSIDKKVRLRNLDIVKQELLFFITNKVAQVKFVDRTFNCNQHHALEIWRFIKENDNGITNFHFEISADILSEEEIALLNSMRPGLVQLEIGVQSTNKETINEIRRMMDVVKLKNIVRSIKKGNNIHIHLDLIAGLPFENLTIFKQSFNEVYEMEPEQLQLGFLKVLKGSYMHDKYKDYEIEYRTQPPYEVLMTKWLSYQDILQLKQVEEMVEVYYNSNQFVSTMKYLVLLFATPFEAYWSLAQYYDEKGYFINTISIFCWKYITTK